MRIKTKWTRDPSYAYDCCQNIVDESLRVNVQRNKGKSGGWFFNVTVLGQGSTMGVAKSEAKAKTFALLAAKLLVKFYGK